LTGANVVIQFEIP